MKWFCTFAFFISLLHSYSIVFVHIGAELPTYLYTAIDQARLFNPEGTIYLIANKEALRKASSTLDQMGKDFLQQVSCETLIRSKSHHLFRKQSTLDKKSYEGLWTFASERFFYLEELIQQYDLKDIFHLENDVMLYRDLSALLPIFKKHYSNKIAVTFDNENRCIPGFVYVSQHQPISKLVKFMAAEAKAGKTDMEILPAFKAKYGDAYIDALPIVTPEYCRDHVLKNHLGAIAKHPDPFFRHFDDFQSIFDAAAIGQYLGGISPRNGAAIPGFINESCLFDPSKFQYVWKEDLKGRWAPFILHKEVAYPINNLHIHSKNLVLFFSKR